MTTTKRRAAEEPAAACKEGDAGWRRVSIVASWPCQAARVFCLVLALATPCRAVLYAGEPTRRPPRATTSGMGKNSRARTAMRRSKTRVRAIPSVRLASSDSAPSSPCNRFPHLSHIDTEGCSLSFLHPSKSTFAPSSHREESVCASRQLADQLQPVRRAMERAECTRTQNVSIRTAMIRRQFRRHAFRTCIAIISLPARSASCPFRVPAHMAACVFQCRTKHAPSRPQRCLLHESGDLLPSKRRKRRPRCRLHIVAPGPVYSRFRTADATRAR